MGSSFTDNMKDSIASGWIICLDESMSIWQTDGHVQEGYFNQGNPTLLAMNTTSYVGDILDFLLNGNC